MSMDADRIENGAFVELHKIRTQFWEVRKALGTAIIGQEEVITQTLITLLSGGHGLFVGVPGLAKTTLVLSLGAILGLAGKRIQFTPDLMPSDITGTEILEEENSGRRNFRYIRGPVFCQLLMADEINRASPRTQAALLQAMQERQVTVAGKKFDLDAPFHVLATQNPLEQEGTYPLPEAQLDRFLLQIDIDYPDLDAEREILIQTTGLLENELTAVLQPQDLLGAQHMVRNMPVGESIVDAILRLTRLARPDDPSAPDFIREELAWGPGPRAGQALMLASRARALLDGRDAPSIDDVIALAPPILRHRMSLNYKARARNIAVKDVIARLTEFLA